MSPHSYFMAFVGFMIIRKTSSQLQGSCITPDFHPGTCVKISSCEYMVNFLSLVKADPSRKDRLNFLLSSVCGKRDMHHLICCDNREYNKGNVPRRPSTRPQESPNQEKCGTLNRISSLIVGGDDAHFGTWPWIAQVVGRYADGSYTQFCGATLISLRYAISAAHCFDRKNPVKVDFLRFGEYNVKTSPDCVIMQGSRICAPQHQDVAVEKVIFHPKYQVNCRVNCNDIVLVRLQSDVQISNYVKPICLPINPLRDMGFSEAQFKNKMAKAAGWGSINPGPNLLTNPAKLQEVLLKIHETDFCERNKRRYPQPENIFCAGSGDNKDTCRGDSGGPLILSNSIESQWFLVGIVTSGPSICGSKNTQGLYVNVIKYIDWILSNMK